MENSIQVRKIKDANLKGGILLDGFPSVGLANAIASECLIHSMKTEFVAVLDSPLFAPLSVIRNSVPNFPARIYVNEETKLGIFVSELNLDASLYRPVANTMLDWAATNGCELIISSAGIPYDGADSDGDSEHEVYATASTKHAMKRFESAGIKRLANGSVGGIPAVLLNEGSWRGFGVIVLLVKVLKEAPDFRAAAAIAEAVTRLAPGASCDIGALLNEAEVTEKTLKRLRIEQAQAQAQQGIYG